MIVYKVFEVLVSFENLLVVEMVVKLFVMDKRGRDALRCRVIASEFGMFVIVFE